jgi:hypothetical protein
MTCLGKTESGLTSKIPCSTEPSRALPFACARTGLQPRLPGTEPLLELVHAVLKICHRHLDEADPARHGDEAIPLGAQSAAHF